MRFGVLGPVTAWTDGGAIVTVPGLKVRALLADLLVHEGRPVPADRLIDDLWGDARPGNPAGTLSAKVSQLRRAFEDAEPGSRSLVVTGPAGYSLRVDAASCDALEFQALLDSHDLAGALALWRGPAYADFADESFAETVIARLSDQRLTAQEDHVEARLARGEHNQLISELGGLLAEHPLRERLRAVQLKALYRAGRQSEALDSYEQLRITLADELGLDPSPELVALQRAILVQDPGLDLPYRPGATVARRTNLPAQLTELIGRDQAVAEISSRLDDDRLVTLTGPGGVGKTRLAIATADRLVDRFADGAILVDLAAVAPDALDLLGSITDAVQLALDLRDPSGPGEPGVDRLATALSGRELLLVLDNCERVVEPTAELVDRLLAAAPALSVLATSREPLGLAGEVVWTVPTLDVPPVAGDLSVVTESSSVRLFVARATAADRNFTLDEDSAAAVAVLCRRLDGIPLALELAATRVRALGVHGLVARLDDRFRLLATGHRGAAPRQQTLMAMIDWSWQLLTTAEQAVLRRLAVQADGCTAEAAERVCSSDDLPVAEVIDVLARLVDRSLVVPVHDTVRPRYRLLESIAAYCVERLREAGEHEQVRRRHHRYYAQLARRAGPELYGPRQSDRMRQLDDEAGNLRSAFDGAVADGDPELALELVDALGWYWLLRGRLTEARRCCEAALAVGNQIRGPLPAAVAAWRAGFSFLQGDPLAGSQREAALREYSWAEQYDWAEQYGGAEQSDESGASAGSIRRARAEWLLAFTGSDAGDLETGEALLNRSLAAFRAYGDQWGVAAVLAVRAKHSHVRGDLPALEADAGESARLFRAAGDRWGELQATSWLGAHAELVGKYEDAAALHLACLGMAQELGLWTEVAGELGWLAWISVRQGDYKRAGEYGDQALRLSTEQGNRPGQALAEIALGFAARRTGELASAERRLQGLVDYARRHDGQVLYLSMVLEELGFTAELRGDLATARALHAEAFVTCRTHNSGRGMAWALEGLAGALVDSPEVAAQLLGAAGSARDASALLVTPAESGDLLRVRSKLRAALGDAAFGAEYERGTKLSLEDAFGLLP